MLTGELGIFSIIPSNLTPRTYSIMNQTCSYIKFNNFSAVHLAAVNEVSQMIYATSAAQIRRSVDIFITEGRFIFDFGASMHQTQFSGKIPYGGFSQIRSHIKTGGRQSNNVV